jgi:hypothetical protein
MSSVNSDTPLCFDGGYRLPRSRSPTDRRQPMIPESTRAAWSALGAADPDSMSRDETVELLDASKRVRAWLDSIELRAARQLRRLTEQGRSEAPESALVNSAGHSGRDARDVAARDELCDDHPHLEDALAAGDLTAKHLDAIGAAGRGLPDDVRAEYLAHSDDLLARAQQVSLEQFGRECRELAKHLLAQSRRGLSRCRGARGAACRFQGHALGRQGDRHAQHPRRTRPDPRCEVERGDESGDCSDASH